MAKKSAAKSGKTVATALLELLGVAIEEGLIEASDVAALTGEEKGGKKSSSKAKAKDDDEDDDAEEEEEEEDSEVPDFDDMSEKEMKKFCKDNEIEIPKKVKGEDALREFLNEEFASDEEEEEEEEESESPDFDEMSHKELKAFVKENDLEVSAKVLKDEEALREWLEENFEADADEDEDEDSDEDEEEDEEGWEED